MKKERTKFYMAWVLLVISLIFGLVSLLSPPRGEISSSCLIFIAECLGFVSALIGIDWIESKSKA
jgi:hypothetical protein